MGKGKFIPIMLIFFLIICAIGLFLLNSSKNKNKYSKLIINYQGEEIVKEDLNIDLHFTLENVDFYVSSIQKDLIVLRTNSYVTVNLKNTSEFQIDVNQFANVCFNDDSCAEFRLA